MKNPKVTNHKDELVVRKEAWINLIFGLPTVIVIAISLFRHPSTGQLLKTNVWVTIAAILIIIFVLYLLIRNSLDHRIKLLINIQGIWIHNRGLLTWGDIHFYYFEEIDNGDEYTTLFKIKLRESDKEITINMSLFNTSKNQIESAITTNSYGNKILFLKETY